MWLLVAVLAADVRRLEGAGGRHGLFGIDLLAIGGVRCARGGGRGRGHAGMPRPLPEYAAGRLPGLPPQFQVWVSLSPSRQTIRVSSQTEPNIVLNKCHLRSLPLYFRSPKPLPSKVPHSTLFNTSSSTPENRYYRLIFSL